MKPAKTFLASMLLTGLYSVCLASLLIGCTTINKQDACVAAQTAYSVYLAVINADGQPSKDQIVAAQAAAAVLQQQCGWAPPGAGSKGVPVNDRRGVPIIIPTE